MSQELFLGVAAAVEKVAAHQGRWAGMECRKKAALVSACMSRLVEHRMEYKEAALRKRGYPKTEAEIVLASTMTCIHLAFWLRSIHKYLKGKHQAQGLVKDGVASLGMIDAVTAMVSGFCSFEIHTRREEKRTRDEGGGLSVILGAGNYDAPVDLLTALLIDNHVVDYKFSPLAEELAPVLSKIFKPLLDEGVLSFTRGGAVEGMSLVEHEKVTKWYMTGDSRTAKKILFKSSQEGGDISSCSTQSSSSLTDESEVLRLLNPTIVDKDCTIELGNCTPFIICPGAWTDSELYWNARHLAFGLIYNGGHICGHPQVIVTCKNWDQREKFLNLVAETINQSLAGGKSFYPNTAARMAGIKERLLLESQAKMQLLKNGDVIFMRDITKDSLLLKEEMFCCISGELPLDTEPTTDAFLKEAVPFVNSEIEGTLCVTIISKKSTAMVDKAISTLNYGSVGLNVNAVAGIFHPELIWGGHPENASLKNLHSGMGFFGNLFKIDNPAKTVVRSPFAGPALHAQVVPVSVKEAQWQQQLFDRLLAALCSQNKMAAITSWPKTFYSLIGLKLVQ